MTCPYLLDPQSSSHYDFYKVNAMSNFQLSIHIEKPFLGLVSEDWLRRAVELALVAAGIETPVELGLVIADDETVHELNRSYRGVDKTTDVLAFALSESRGSEIEGFVTPPDGVNHLGEVIISYPQAERQAKEQRHPLERELALLVAHGMLHLLGYDHERPEDEGKMRSLEAKVLSTLEVV